ncbi:FecR family protein [Flavobacterium sp. RHBU_24]|uniref:FecR family protein n=1 Tax=Flavobacterium sp. RHBU_24 TaxID=3391185 RepID=UPI0039850656
MNLNDVQDEWNAIPEKGILPQGAKDRMWENIQMATLQKRRRRSYRWIVAASVAILLLFGGYLFLMQPVAAAKAIVTNTYPHDIRLLRLPDGSRIWVNQNTEISYPSEFAGDTREVTLSGEAFFEVAKDPDKPFIITSGAVRTTVLGTSFNIDAYAGKAIEVSVRSGLVKVQASGNTVMLKKGDAAIVPMDNRKLQKTVGIATEPEWKKALIDIDGLTLEAVINKIQTEHNMKVVYTKEELRHLKIKGTLDTRQGVTEMMQTVAFALGLNITSTDGNSFTISR